MGPLSLGSSIRRFDVERCTSGYHSLGDIAVIGAGGPRVPHRPPFVRELPAEAVCTGIHGGPDGVMLVTGVSADARGGSWGPCVSHTGTPRGPLPSLCCSIHQTAAIGVDTLMEGAMPR